MITDNIGLQSTIQPLRRDMVAFDYRPCVSGKRTGFFIRVLKFREEKPSVKVKNIGQGEGIFRLIMGVLLVILAFFISGMFRWISGLIGVVLILTGTFGY
jgi:hypothetical protein